MYIGCKFFYVRLHRSKFFYTEPFYMNLVEYGKKRKM